MSATAVSAAPKLRPIDEGLRSRGIHVFYTTWLRWIRKKERGLPAKKIGGRYYVDLDELDAWIAAQEVHEATRPEKPPSIPQAMRADVAEVVLHRRRMGGRGRRCTPPAVDKTSGGRA